MNICVIRRTQNKKHTNNKSWSEERFLRKLEIKYKYIYIYMKIYIEIDRKAEDRW